MDKVVFADLPKRGLRVHTVTGDVVFNAKQCAGEVGRYPEEYAQYLAEQATVSQGRRRYKAKHSALNLPAGRKSILGGIYNEKC